MKALFFDLDDTLFLEREFVASGYRALAHHVERRFSRPCREVFFAMIATLAKSGRSAVLPMVSERFTAGRLTVRQMVTLYRNHRPRIELMPGYDGLLRRLRTRFTLAIVTDGLPAVQRRKVAALGLNELVHTVVYTWNFGPARQKPDPLPFERLLRRMRLQPCEALLVGDNLEKDGGGAANAGLGFVHVRNRNRRRGDRFSSGARPLFSVENLFQLIHRLDSMG